MKKKSDHSDSQETSLPLRIKRGIQEVRRDLLASSNLTDVVRIGSSDLGGWNDFDECECACFFEKCLRFLEEGKRRLQQFNPSTELGSEVKELQHRLGGHIDCFDGLVRKLNIHLRRAEEFKKLLADPHRLEGLDEIGSRLVNDAFSSGCVLYEYVKVFRSIFDRLWSFAYDLQHKTLFPLKREKDLVERIGRCRRELCELKSLVCNRLKHYLASLQKIDQRLSSLAFS